LVGDTDLEIFLPDVRLNADVAPEAELDRVAEQVHQHLFEPADVTLEKQAVRRIDPHPKTLGLGLGGDALHGFPNDVGRRERLDRQIHPPRFDFGDIQDVVDQRQEVGGAALDHGQLFSLLRRHVARHSHEDQAGESEDGVERRPQLVAHAGQEQAFQPVQLDQPLVGRGQFPGPFLHPALEAFVEFADFLLGFLALADVADDDEIGRPPLVGDPGGGDLGRDPSAAGVHQRGFVHRRGFPPGHPVPVVARQPLPLLFRDHVEERPAEKFPGLTSGHGAQARVDIDKALVLDDDDRVLGVFDQSPVFLLAFPEGGNHPLPFRIPALDLRQHAIESAVENADLVFPRLLPPDADREVLCPGHEADGFRQAPDRPRQGPLAASRQEQGQEHAGQQGGPGPERVPEKDHPVLGQVVPEKDGPDRLVVLENAP